MTKKTLGGVVALALALSLSAGPTPALAADDPATTDRDLILQTYDATPETWAPQGTVIADSGFDPAFDSFPFVNYGTTFGVQNALLGYPEEGQTLGNTALEAQALFGTKQACTYGSGNSCVLNPAVKQWINQVNASMAGGHCFGIAAVVAGLFNGVISRAGLTPSDVNVGVALSPVMQRTIAKWFSTQLFVLGDEATKDADFLPPDQLVNQLVQFLPSGTLPYLLVLFWEEDGQTEGHAITPYAVTSRGPGLVDIAVYDNNYPLQARAVHVDLAANTWEYEVFASPGQAPTMAAGDATSLNLGLVPLTQLTGRQDCPFCVDAPEGRSLLTVTAQSATDPDNSRFAIVVQDADGRPLKGVRKLPSTDPNGATDSFSVPTSADYRVRVEALSPGESLVTVSSFAPGEALTTILSARTGGTADVLFRHGANRVDLKTNDKAEPFIIEMDRDRRALDHALTMLVGSKAWAKADVPTPELRLRESKGALVVDVVGKGTTEGALLVERISPATGVTSAVAGGKKGLTLRPGDRIVIDTATWGSGEIPKATITDADGRTRPLPLKAASEAQRQLVAEQAFGALGSS